MRASEYAERLERRCMNVATNEATAGFPRIERLFSDMAAIIRSELPTLRASEDLQRFEAKRRVGELIAHTNMEFKTTNHAHKFVDRVVDACFGKAEDK